MDSEYPVRLDVDYPDRDLDRVSSFFRIFAVIPIAIVLGLIGGSYSGSYGDGASAGATFAGFLVAPTALMIIFRQKYPRWWFDFNVELARFTTRVYAYMGLMDDQYPSTDEEQSVHLEIDYPDAKEGIGQFMPLVKWFLAIPHYIILFVLSIAAFFALIGAWFAVVFTGRYPKGIFNFLVGILRWSSRVFGYAFLLVTDEYPPFSLEP